MVTAKEYAITAKNIKTIRIAEKTTPMTAPALSISVCARCRIRLSIPQPTAPAPSAARLRIKNSFAWDLNSCFSNLANI